MSELNDWRKRALKTEKHRAAKRVCKHCGGPGANAEHVCDCCAKLNEIQGHTPVI